MQDSIQQQAVHEARRRRPSRAITGLILTCALLAAPIAGLALASAPALVNAARNSHLHKTILVDAQGRTLYVLTPETVHRLLCKSSECLEVWPPLTAPRNSHTKITLGRGVHGTFGFLHRSDGVWQVTLNGLPLYRFSGDTARGEASGEGFESFGGTWHAVLASGKVA